MSSTILDSGNRRQFDSGAVRDIVEGKGRCDLLPLFEVSELIRKTNPTCADILQLIYIYTKTGASKYIINAIQTFSTHIGYDVYTCTLEVAKHYEQGCNKYGERNWEKGIPLHCYIDSGIRHLLKYFRGDSDEPHDRAFVWNMFGAIWTQVHYPELVDLPYLTNTTSN